MPRALSLPCPLPVPTPGSYRLAQPPQRWDEPQQLLILRVPRPRWHLDPVVSLGRDRADFGSLRPLSGTGTRKSPPRAALPHLGREALHGVVQGHHLGQVPAQAGQVLPVAALGADTIRLGEAAPGGETEPWGPCPVTQGVPNGASPSPDQLLLGVQHLQQLLGIVLLGSGVDEDLAERGGGPCVDCSGPFWPPRGDPTDPSGVTPQTPPGVWVPRRSWKGSPRIPARVAAASHGPGREQRLGKGPAPLSWHQGEPQGGFSALSRTP